jgi:aminoglycoside 3-N-acetyltransferase
VGHLTNVFRLRPAAVRSLHPTHSVAAIGPRAAEFTAGHELDDTPCGAHSPYQRIVQWAGKVVLLGVRLDSCTLMHAFEEMAGIPWLFNPGIEDLKSIRKDGRVVEVPSRRHARDRELDRSFSELEPMLMQKGILNYGPIGEAQVRIVAARPAAELLVPFFKENPDFLLKKN